MQRINKAKEVLLPSPTQRMDDGDSAAPPESSWVREVSRPGGE